MLESNIKTANQLNENACFYNFTYLNKWLEFVSSGSKIKMALKYTIRF